MTFDWVRFLSSHGIEHTTKGHGATRNQVVIRCPWCGASDQGLHLSINLDGAGYWCLRAGKGHSGKAAHRLVATLLKCSPDMARSITGVRGISLTEDFSEMIVRTMSGNPKVKPWRDLKLPKEFKPFPQFSLPSAELFVRHMKSPQRKFTSMDISRFTSYWDVHYCTTGKFKGRIIFPIYFNKELVSWSGRTIYPAISPKYLTLSTEGESPLAKAGISNYLLWYDDIVNDRWEAVVICEGPMDALKINCLGLGSNITATCIFTAQPSRAQIDLLHTLLPKTKRMILLLDQGTTANAMRSMQKLPREVEYMTLPKGIKDPCLLTSLDFLDGGSGSVRIRS